MRRFFVGRAIGMVVVLVAVLIFLAVTSFGQTGEVKPPLDNFHQHEQKLTFGLFVTPDPANNPIDPPERFTGYHTALDLEIIPGQETQDVPVYASCGGEVLTAREAEGYGGVIVHTCRIGRQQITVLYGHLDFNRFEVRPAQNVKAGQRLGFLAPANSAESGFTRKHLHWGMHRGLEIKLLGYVQTREELAEFINPKEYLP